MYKIMVRICDTDFSNPDIPETNVSISKVCEGIHFKTMAEIMCNALNKDMGGYDVQFSVEEYTQKCTLENDSEMCPHYNRIQELNTMQSKEYTHDYTPND